MILTIILALILFTILVLGHEFGHFLVAKFFNLRVLEFGFGFPPKIIAKRKGETLISFNLIPFGGFVKIYGENPAEVIHEDEERSFQNLSPLKRAAVIVAGVVMNLLIGYLALSAVFMIGIPASLFVSQVVSHGPAALSGITPGDELVDFKKANDFVGFLTENKGREVNLNIRRGEEKIAIKVTPRINPPAGQGRLGVVVAEGGIPKEDLIPALTDGGKATYETTRLIFNSLIGIFIGIFRADFSSLNNVTGPVGIFGILGTASHLGIQYVLQLLGLISLNLAVLNLLPIPALDGGRLLFILIEKITGRPAHYKFEALTHTLGFLLLILLMTIITIRDIIRIL